MTHRSMPFPLPQPLPAVADDGMLPSRKVHLVGCAGSGMKGLADLLHGWGYQVSGSDLSTPPASLQRLIERGVPIAQGHAAAHVPADVDQLIHSLAIPATNPERVRATELGIVQQTYSQMVGQLLARRQGVCIAGTHGKSTTTAMTAWILTEAGLNPTALFGADLCGSGLSSWTGTGEHFVVESCEYQRSFLDYRPHCAAILSVEPDHFDYFTDADDLQRAFGQFAAQVHQDGFVLTRFEDQRAIRAAQMSSAGVLTFGWVPEADWWAADVRPSGWGSRCRVFRRGQFISELIVPQPGRHNVLNALAATAMAFELGVPPRDLRGALAEFPGIHRRFELVGSFRGVTLISDYAHHPTAVAATLETARQQFGSRPVRVIFQPHQISRTQQLLAEFAASFQLADSVLITPIFAARESAADLGTQVAAELVAQIRQRGTPAESCTSLDHAAQVVEDALNPGDVLITMGAGDIDRIQHEFTRRLFRDSPSRRAFGPADMAASGRTSSILSRSA
ncbi:UDP-N-acetylmuramate--L-alanine ligase [bacterium]|nr:UDP-N-acetylmuramate--L-alanine ligase [bacterium]